LEVKTCSKLNDIDNGSICAADKKINCPNRRMAVNKSSGLQNCNRTRFDVTQHI
jgi:hypothetical protein